MDDVRKVSLFPGGIIQMPPSKSISHRAVICSALSPKPCSIDNLADSQDIEATMRCMREIKARRVDSGIGSNSLLDCGESGSTLRCLIPIAASMSGAFSFTGHGRLMERPLGPYLDTLEKHGAHIRLDDNILTVSGPLKAGLYQIPGNISSQFVSGLLLALPLLEGDSEIHMTTRLESASYVDLTIEVMERFGVAVEHDQFQRFRVAGGQKYQAAGPIAVDADYSQAAFFLVAGALGFACECRGLSSESRQGDRKILDILRQSGVEIEISAQGGLIAKPGKLIAQTVDGSDIPDLVPPLAALFAFCEGTSRIVNAGRLRLKESDRLDAIAMELNKLGARVSIGEDSMTIEGQKTIRGGAIKSHNDHRIAMMGAVAAIGCERPVYIEGSGCVAKSYPEFWRDFGKKEMIR